MNWSNLKIITQYNTYIDNIFKLFITTKVIILELDINGALKIKESGIESKFVAVFPPSIEALRERIIKR